MAAPSNKGNRYDIATRAQIVTLRHFTNFTNDEIARWTGCSPRQISGFNSTAIQRGFVKEEGKPLKIAHLEDKPRSGRPTIRTEDTIEEVLAYVRASKASRSLSATQIAKSSIQAFQGCLSFAY